MRINFFFHIQRLFYKASFILGITIICLVKTFAQKETLNLGHDSLQIDGIQRTFHYYKSKSIHQNPRLIFVLHGSNGSGLLMQKITGEWFETLADKHQNTLIVYPDGYKKHWNECRKEANFEANLQNIDDVAFFEQMIQYFHQKYKVNKNEVSVIGHSNGGHMVYRLAKERPNLFKKFVAVSANLPTVDNDDCYLVQNKPVSIMVINGTADPINPYNGGEVLMTGTAKRGSVISTDATLKYWIDLLHGKRLKINKKQFEDVDTSDGSIATEESYKSRKKEVRLIKVENGGHVLSFPSPFEMPKALGNANKDINMIELAFDFFLEK